MRAQTVKKTVQILGTVKLVFKEIDQTLQKLSITTVPIDKS